VSYSDPFGLAPCSILPWKQNFCTWTDITENVAALWNRLRNEPEQVEAGLAGASEVFSALAAPTLMGGVFAESRSINPATVRFSQSSISPSFRDGGTVAEMAAGLKSGAIDPASVAPIRLVVRNGQLFTLDNRRLAAFQQAGVAVPYRMATPQEAAAEAWKFTTKNGGISIRIRGQQ
jgi:hypothetical protein